MHYRPFTFTFNWQLGWQVLDPKVCKLICRDNNNLTQHHLKPDLSDNLLSEERQALYELCRKSQVVIKPADKGSKTVILDKFQYTYEDNYRTHINYGLIPNNVQKKTQQNSWSILAELYNNQFITNKQRDYLYGLDNPRDRQF